MSHKNIGDRVRALREKSGLSLDDLARVTGLTGAYLGRLERNEDKYKNPTIETLKKIAGALSVTAGYLMEGKKSDHKPATSALETDFELHDIPVLSGTVEAGTFTTSFNDWEGERVSIPVKNPQDKLAWRISGNSMFPDYCDGDLVIIQVGRNYYDGCDVIAENDHGVTIKKLKILKDGSVELRPRNPEFSTIRIKDSNRLDILGVVVGFYRDVTRRKK